MNIYARIAAKAKEQQAILDKIMAENRAMTDEEKKSFDNLQTEIDNLKDQAEMEEKVKATNKYLDAPANKAPAPAMPTTMDVQDEKLDDGGFKSLGELAFCAKFGDDKGRINNLSTGDVGILIPPKFAQDILKLNGEEEIVMPRATIIPAGDPPDAPFTVPYLQQGADGVLGGIELNWTGEGKTIKDVKEPEIKDLTLTPQEVSGLATINNKTLKNWSASGSFIQTMLRQAYAGGRDMKFLRGSGNGCPLGILNAPGKLAISRKTSATITYEDLVTMISRLYAGPGAPVWIVNQTIMPALATITDPAGNYIFSGGDATKGIPASLIGIPIKWNGKTPSLGAEGDITLAKINYYLIKEGSGPYLAISEHVKFSSNQTVFKIVANIDGQPWVKEPLALEDGSTTVSPYVVLK